jgi:uncharacterized protein DUF732
MRHAAATLALLALTLTGCATTVAGTASPPPAPYFPPSPTELFLENLQQQGIASSNPERDARLGDKVCFHWTNTADRWDDVYPAIYTLSGLGQDTALFMIVATTRLCPEQIRKIPGQ